MSSRVTLILVNDLIDAIVLEMLAVHPDAQGKGVGEALVRWGLQNADEKGAEVSFNHRISVAHASRCL